MYDDRTHLTHCDHRVTHRAEEKTGDNSSRYCYHSFLPYLDLYDPQNTNSNCAILLQQGRYSIFADHTLVHIHLRALLDNVYVHYNTMNLTWLCENMLYLWMYRDTDIAEHVLYSDPCLEHYYVGQ